MINREDKRLSNSVVDILNMLEMGESVDMIASDMNSKTTNIRRIIRENDIGQDTISTTLHRRRLQVGYDNVSGVGFSYFS